MVFLALLKPFIYFWAGLNFMDDMSVVMKIARLVGATTFHGRTSDPEVLCNLCDDIIDNLMKGTETLETVPCSWVCLGTPKCTKMCDAMKAASENTLDFPCIAAGYCIQDDENTGDLNDVDCKKGPLFSCEPKKFCRKTRHGLKYSCQLKPGLGRWVHMQKSAGRHTAAIASGLIQQKRCGEPGAGPYCIAEPIGFSKVLHFLSLVLSLFYGGYRSIVAIETPGGDDDQQWLTFWVIFVLTMVIEQVFARVLLSRFPLYHHSKFIVFVYLIFFDGANCFYRKLRRKLSHWSSYFATMMETHNHMNAQNQLDSMIGIGGPVVTKRIALLEKDLDPKKRSSCLVSQNCFFWKTEKFWEYDYTDVPNGIKRNSLAADEKLFHLSKWILGSEGMKEMEENLDSTSIALLLERAAPVVSFQPKFLHIHLISTKPGPRGRLPVMDDNGKTDCYVKFSIEGITSGSSDVPKKPIRNQSNLKEMVRFESANRIVTSRIAYRTLHPEWNQFLELPIEGGALDIDGTYRTADIGDKMLLLEAWDADCGKWGVALEVFKVMIFVWTCSLLSAYIMGGIDFVFLHTLKPEQWWWKVTIIAITIYIVLGLGLSYLMSVVLRADDEYIGSSSIPMEILTDQRGHSLLVTLTNDSRKECGILRVKLRLSEN